MLNDMATNQTGRRTQYVTIGWCRPGLTLGPYLLGIVLVVGGSIWLMNNLNLLPRAIIDTFWPLVLVGVGLVYLAATASGQAERSEIHGG